MTERRGRLLAVDGVRHGPVAAAARRTLARCPPRERGGVSWWDASGVFEELAMGNDDAGRASARTLLLLYAADLAFRLRWEIRPMLEKGRTVVAAPYVETAVAFGRAAGIPAEWIRDLFQFAPVADATDVVSKSGATRAAGRGFIEFVCAYQRDGGRTVRVEQIASRFGGSATRGRGGRGDGGDGGNGGSLTQRNRETEQRGSTRSAKAGKARPK